MVKYHPWKPPTKIGIKDGKSVTISLHEVAESSKLTNRTRRYKDALMYKTFPGQLFHGYDGSYAITVMEHGVGLRVKELRRLSPRQERQLAAGLITSLLRKLCQ